MDGSQYLFVSLVYSWHWLPRCQISHCMLTCLLLLGLRSTIPAQQKEAPLATCSRKSRTSTPSSRCAQRKLATVEVGRLVARRYCQSKGGRQNCLAPCIGKLSEDLINCRDFGEPPRNPRSFLVAYLPSLWPNPGARCLRSRTSQGYRRAPCEGPLTAGKSVCPALGVDKMPVS